MSRKCETCFFKIEQKCPFCFACKFPVWERFGNNWQTIRAKNIQKLEHMACQTFSSVSSVGAREVVSL